MNLHSDVSPDVQAVAYCGPTQGSIAAVEESDGCEVSVELEALLQERRSLGAGTSLLATALEYLARGWTVIPVPYRGKNPARSDWQELRITEETAPQWFNSEAQNVGVQLGELSGGLADVDLDTAEAVRAGPYFLARTLCFGRPSKPRSHWLYRSDLWQTEDTAWIQFKFITGEGEARTERTILELRIGGGGKGAQTIFPGSTHETGEPIAWDEPAAITHADGADLKQRCARAAAAALLAEHFPSKGARHDSGLTLGGFLSRCGFSRPDTELFAEAVTIASGQPREKVKDVRKTAGEAWEKAQQPGGRARGFPLLAETFGKNIAKHVAKWLDYRESGSTAWTGGRAAADGRPGFQVPDPDAELIPVMRLLDERLLTDEPEPPMRTVEGWPVEVRVREPVGMHELMAAGANDEEGDSGRLPAPKIHVLARHNACTMALLIERYIYFFKQLVLKDGTVIEIPKRLPSTFVTHYLDFDQSKLPRVSGLTTMPLVLPNGELLATNGLDRKRKTIFCIAPEIVEMMPQGPIPEAAVEKAMRFLTDQWLVDVKAGYPGKGVLLAAALTLFERALFGERPAFFITAGKRGGGKTTAINMVSLAATGKRAAAMPWSPSQEERRKAIFAALLQAVPLITWDNIAAGSSISCPVIEAALTAGELEDRVLKESRNERVECSAVMIFTGNNILPKGDLASRTLVCRLDVDRPDPENREFKHPDPFAWTLGHRAEIIEALYTLLLGNPRLRQRPRDRSPAKTRFKQWWHLVGSAIEFAAKLTDEPEPVDFGELFLAVEKDDEAAASLAEVLQCLDRLAGGKPFGSAAVSKWMSSDDDDGQLLKGFFAARRDAVPSKNSIARKLKANSDAPTWVGEGIWTLRVSWSPAERTTQCHIEKSE
jgi:hypothetical protein